MNTSSIHYGEPESIIQRMKTFRIRKRIRQTGIRHLARVVLYRLAHKLYAPHIRSAQWDAPLPDLAQLAMLISTPADPAPVLAIANDICAGRFTLLGFPPADLGTPPDWHTDPSSGHRWEPIAPANSLDLMTHDSPADVRVVWELNRCHHAVALGMAWRASGNDRYPATFASLVIDWLATNPLGCGVNWACAMEVAIRAVNWLFACALMQEALSTAFVRELLGALLTHGRYIRANLELASVTTNHYLADLSGLAILGLALPGGEPRRWWRFARRELAREFRFQVYPDGVDFEASTCYHRLATELLDLPVRLAEIAGSPFPDALVAGLGRMHSASTAFTRPDGVLPLIGDSDDGCLLPPYALPPSSTTTAAGSTAFPHAGIYVMRHDDRYLICDCGTNGQRGNGGHAHNDTLSFELYAGRPWIVDLGTFAYTGDLTAYNGFRSTVAHNTLVVDGEEQARFDLREPFLLAPDAQPTVHRWESTSEYDLLDAEHAGYHRLPHPVTHRRQILFDKHRGLWLVHDIVVGSGRHRLDWRFHFAPLSVARQSPESLTVRACAFDGANLLLIPVERPVLNLTIEEGWVSYQYGCRERAPVVRYTACQADLPFVVTFAFVPTNERLSIAESNELITQSWAVLETHS